MDDDTQPDAEPMLPEPAGRAPLSDAERTELAEHEQAIETALREAAEVTGRRLREVQEKRLYRERYDTFDAYCEQRWGLTARRVRQITTFVRVLDTLAASGTTVPLPANERQARELAPLLDDPEAMRDAWERRDEPQPEAEPPVPEGEPLTGPVEGTVRTWRHNAVEFGLLYRQIEMPATWQEAVESLRADGAEIEKHKAHMREHVAELVEAGEYDEAQKWLAWLADRDVAD